MEYTLDDAYEALKDIRSEREEEIENLMNANLSNQSNTLNQSTVLEEVKAKQQILSHCLYNQVLLQDEPNDYPVPRTSDLHIEVLTEIEEELRISKDLLDTMHARQSDIEEDICYLEKKLKGVEQMKEAYLGAAEMVAKTTYDKELLITKRIFQDVKKDLHLVVDILFPENMGFKDLLADLTSSYGKGGDDLYVDTTPDSAEYVNFLLAADIAVHHRNDKSKIRLTDVL